MDSTSRLDQPAFVQMDPKRWPPDRGAWANWCDVFGSRPLLWGLPFHAPSDARAMVTRCLGADSGGREAGDGHV